MDSNVPHDLEQRFRNIEAHLGIGKVDEDTGTYSTELHESLTPAEPDVPQPGAQAQQQAPVPTAQEQFNAMSDEEKAEFLAANEHHG